MPRITMLRVLIIILICMAVLLLGIGIVVTWKEEEDKQRLLMRMVVAARGRGGDDEMIITPTTRHHEDSTLFLPGSLTDDRTQILKQCLVPSRTFKLSPSQGCTVSNKYKLIYHMTPKSGSSTGRHVIKKDFDGQDRVHDCDTYTRRADGENWTQIVTLRNPTTRAFASYEEMFVRNINSYPVHHIPHQYAAFFKPYERFTYPNYSAMFDNPVGVKQLTRSYEQFMRDWDGQVFDMHLGSQVSYNLRSSPRNNGLPPHRPNADHLTYVFDTHAMEHAFLSLARMVGLEKTPRVIKGRAYPRRLNVSDVSAEAFQAMCRIYAVDYCCLNYELPPKCLEAPQGGRVRCRWVNDGGGRKMIETVIV